MKKFFITFILFLISALPSYCEVVHITMDQAVTLALENNLDLKSKRKHAEVMEQNIKIANALKNPQFQSNFLMGKVTRGNSSQFGLAVPIEVSKRGIRKKIAQKDLDIVQKEIKAKELDLKIEVMRNYFYVLYAKSVVKILQDREKLFKEMQSIAEQHPKNSSNYKLDVLHSQMKYQKQVVFLNRAKANLLIAQFELNNSLNIKGSEILYDTVEPSLFVNNLSILDLNLMPYQEIEDTAMKYSYSLSIAQDNIQRSEQEITNEKHKRIPDITVGGGYAYQTAHQTGTGSLPGAYVGVNADIPLFYFYTPEVNRAKIVLERSKIDKDSFENHLKYALKEDYNKFKYAKINVAYYNTILKESNTILEEHKKRYAKGQSSLLNLLQVENMHKETLRDYIDAVQRYYDAYLDMMHNVGHDILLQTDL